MKERSVQVPALKDLMDRPLNLGSLELVDQAVRTAGFGSGWSFWSIWGGAFRSLKPHGSFPEHVLDLLLFLDESSDEKMQQMDLDDVTVEHLTAGRSALREAIGHVELALKSFEEWWQCRQSAPWLKFLDSMTWPWVESKYLSILQAMDARASILMTRLERQAEKENDTTCLQEVV